VKQIHITERVWVESKYRSSFREGTDGVNWLRKRVEGVEVQFTSGTLYLFPWGQIRMVAYQ
jgi:hypothetical protein